MEKWQKFLDSLAGRGGNILMLAFFVLLMMFVTALALMVSTTPAQAITVILTTFSTFTGAFINMLTGNQRETRRTDPAPNPPTPGAPAP